MSESGPSDSLLEEAPKAPSADAPETAAETPPDAPPADGLAVVPGAVAADGSAPVAFPPVLEGAPEDVDETDAGPAKPLAPPLPFVPAQELPPPSPEPEVERRWLERIERLVREAKAQGDAPSAAPLWFEAGRIYEAELGRLREAATHYGEANKADPTFLPVIHAARRLFAQLGKWGMVVYLIDAELKLEGAPAAALLVEKGGIHETKLGQPELAVSLYREALTHDPAYGPAVDNLVRHLRRGEEWTAVAEVLEGAVAASTKLSQKVSWLVDLARLAESRLQDDRRALAFYEEARSLAPSRRLILTALRRLYGRVGDDEKLAETLDHLALLTTSPAEAVQYLLRRAQILAGAGDEEGAIHALESARARMPSDTLVLSELARLYERREAAAQLVDVLEAQAKATHDISEKVALFAEAGRMAEERLEDGERAIVYYYACIEQDPTYQPALAALGKLYARGQRWRELADVFDIQIGATTENAVKVPLLYKLAELLNDRLGDVEGAIERLRGVLELSPGYVPALKLISSLFARQGRWMDLVEMYEVELAGQDDRDQAIYLLERIANLYENQLESPANAIEAYKRMLERQPGYLPALRSLGRLYARTQQWEELIQINVEESQLIGDQSHVVALLHRNGELYEEKLGRPEDAIDAYRHALTLMPNYLPALRALGRIYAKEGRYDDLIAMNREEAEVARNPGQRAQILCDVAELYEAQLGDRDAAAAVYREVLSELPTYHPAIRALSRLALATGDFQGLVDTLKSELDVLSEPRDRALMRCRIAELKDRHLSDREGAKRLYEEAVAESPGLLVAHEQLVALCARAGDDEGEARARERLREVIPDVDGRVANLRALGELYLHRLDDAPRALAAYEALLAERPEDRPALRSAVDCALHLRDYAAAIRFAEALAAVEPVAEEVASLCLQVATWKESHVDPPQDPLKSYLKALEYDPLNPVALRAVEKEYVERGEWQGLFLLYERERDGTDVPARVADLSMKMADIAERRLGDIELAAGQFETALKAQPDLLPAIARLKECYAQLQRPEDQLRMLAFEANASRDDEHAIHTLLEVAALQRDKFQNVEAAAESLEQVLRRSPHHPQAYAELEALLSGSGRHEALAELYARKGDASEADPALRMDLYLRAAYVLVDKLGVQGVPRAVELYEKVLTLEPGHPTALAQVGNLSFGLRRFERARDAYEALMAATSDANIQAAAAFSLGVIYQDHLPDADKAAEALELCLQAQPSNKEALTRLAKASLERGLMPAALKAHQQLLALASTDEERLAQHIAIAELYEDGFKEAAQAAAAYERALGVATDPKVQQQLLEKAAALYQRTGNLDGYLSVAGKHATTIASSEPRRAADILLANARLVLEHKSDRRRAIEMLDEGLRYAPDHNELMGALADLCTEETSLSARGVELHRRLFQTGVVRVDSLHAVYRAWQRAKQGDRAFVAAEVLSFLGAADDDEQVTYASLKSKVPLTSEEELDVSQVSGWIVHKAQKNVVHEILSAVALELSKLEADDISVYKVERKDILKPRSNEPVRKLADTVARNLGGLGFDLYKTSVKPHTVMAHHGPTPILVVGSELVRAYQTREQRFLLGRGLMAMRCGHHLVRELSVNELAVLLSAIAKAVDKSVPPLRDHPDLEGLTKRVSASLSRHTRRMLQEPVAQLVQGWQDIDLAAFLAAIPMTEARAGLVVSGSFPTAARLYARHRGTLLSEDPQMLIASLEADPVLNDLFTFALSDEHFSTRQTLRFAVDT